ncbi:MAG: SOS response-associated peptidase [Candidatus Thiodiazotropha lotti]|uniref:Abasic site processing protein n=1 Tax=Candidatus Thiodiazotropha lotti TaxID=2792787 RepID=A0A9E4N1P3_9GAMM|nr:SOS response-associated peptidase [Candidatus Thiodiazotropha lotti]MCW4205066.1 SOS response-associated peptidase [Candidatus Thiodiazotropha lotti]
MCGRFYLDVKMDELEGYFSLEATAIELKPRYNIAPSQDILAVAAPNGERVLGGFHWGLIPFWAKDEKIGYKTINARAETVDNKPAYRAAFKYRRCLIPCSGFFEWKKENNIKQPYCFRPTSQPLFALAGLYEHWQDKSGREIDSCTILVGEANQDVAPIHDRMPIILKPEDFDCWLDPQVQTKEQLLPLLRPAPPGGVDHYPVSRAVNSPGNDHADLIKNISNSDQFRLT